MRRTTRSLFGIAAVLAAALACGAPETNTPEKAPSTVREKPAQPVELNILDVAGNLQLTQGMIDEFVAENPDVISKVNYTKSTARRRRASCWPSSAAASRRPISC